MIWLRFVALVGSAALVGGDSACFEETLFTEKSDENNVILQARKEIIDVRTDASVAQKEMPETDLDAVHAEQANISALVQSETGWGSRRRRARRRWVYRRRWAYRRRRYETPRRREWIATDAARRRAIRRRRAFSRRRRRSSSLRRRATKSTSVHCASENSYCKCHGYVRYGRGTRWSSWKKVSGSVKCANSVFGNVWKLHKKMCQCKAVATTHRRRSRTRRRHSKTRRRRHSNTHRRRSRTRRRHSKTRRHHSNTRRRRRRTRRRRIDKKTRRRHTRRRRSKNRKVARRRGSIHRRRSKVKGKTALYKKYRSFWILMHGRRRRSKKKQKVMKKFSITLGAAMKSLRKILKSGRRRGNSGGGSGQWARVVKKSRRRRSRVKKAITTAATKSQAVKVTPMTIKVGSPTFQ